MLRPLPYHAPDKLVKFWDTNTEKGLVHDPFSPVTFMDYKALPVFADAAAWWRPDVNLLDPGLDPVRVKTIEASGNLFSVLGAATQLGPGFPAGGPFFSNDLIAVISDRLWRTRYNADPAVIGKLLNLNGTSYQVVGVMPAGFRFPDDVDVWQRLRWDLTQHSRSAHFMEGVARLADGVSLDQARGAGTALAARLGTEFATSNKGWSFGIVPLLDDQLGYYRPALYVLFGAVGLLFVIGCLNVASLLLTRALSRAREIAVRTALGATPRQIVTQLLAESLVLSVFGAAAGLLVALVALPAIIAVTPVEVPRLAEAAISGRVLALALGLVALHDDRLRPGAGADTGAEARRHRPAVGRARQFARHAARLPGSGRGRSGARLRAARQLCPARPDGRTDDPRSAGCARRRRRADERPVVADVLVARILADRGHAPRDHPRSTARAARRHVGRQYQRSCRWIMDGADRSSAATSRRCAAEEAPQAQHHSVSEGYLETMGATLLDGRLFTAQDTATTEAVVVLNETAAKRYFSGESAVGREMLSWSSQIGPLGQEPDLAGGGERAPDSAAASCRRGHRRHPKRGARHAGGTGGVFSDAAVSVQRRNDRHLRA